MARYTHSFDTRVCIVFESDLEDLDEALAHKLAWLHQVGGSAAQRRWLLSSDESIKTLIEGIVWNQTDDTQLNTPASPPGTNEPSPAGH
jgi:hypothetical protein